MKEKLYMLLKNGFLITKYLFILIRLFLIKISVKIIKNNWYLSKNRNYYNPTLAATVYRYGSIKLLAGINSIGYGDV